MKWFDDKLKQIVNAEGGVVEKTGQVGKALVDYFFDQLKGADINVKVTFDVHQVKDATPNKP